MRKTAGSLAGPTGPFRPGLLSALKSLIVLCGLLCLGCSGPSMFQGQVEKLQQQLDHNQKELDTLKEELADVRLWQTRQQKTVDDYTAILLRRGVENYHDEPEWQKRRVRAESYDSTCQKLEGEINQLEEVVIPDIKVALQAVKGSK